MSEPQTAGTRRRLTQHDRARVWERVVVERGRGEKWRDIAERAGLSERQCRRIYRAHTRSSPTLEREYVLREVLDGLADFDAAIEQLATISMTSSSNWVRVKAIRARLNARSRKLELLSVAGVLANVLAEVDARAVARAVISALDEHRVPAEARAAVLAALRDSGAPVGD